MPKSLPPPPPPLAQPPSLIRQLPIRLSPKPLQHSHTCTYTHAYTPTRPQADNVGTTVTKMKYQTTSEHFGGDDSDSDSHEQVRLQKETRQLRKPRHAPFPIQVLASADLESLAPELLTRQTSNPVHNTSPTRSLSRKRALHSRVERRCTVKRKIQTPAVNWKRALEVQSDPSKTRRNCRLKRKRWNSSFSTTLGSQTTSITNLPNVIGKALTEEKISSGIN
jgi:hypothetical protein